MKLKRRSRSLARDAALSVMGFRDDLTGSFKRSTRRARLHFLYMHSVPTYAEGQFTQLVDMLAEDHTFISHDEATRRLVHGPIDRPYLSLSFDDGFASNAVAGRILAQRGIQACFFITTNFIGVKTLAEARQFFRGSVGVEEEALTWNDVDALLAGGHEIGNHTANHLNLAKLPRAQLEDEIESAASTLEKKLGSRPAHFAWPYGQLIHANAEVASVAFSTGHRTCASAVRGAHVASAASMGTWKPFLRRDHIMAEWPIQHTRYFVGRSARRADASSNRWPQQWLERGPDWAKS